MLSLTNNNKSSLKSKPTQIPKTICNFLVNPKIILMSNCAFFKSQCLEKYVATFNNFHS